MIVDFSPSVYPFSTAAAVKKVIVSSLLILIDILSFDNPRSLSISRVSSNQFFLKKVADSTP